MKSSLSIICIFISPVFAEEVASSSAAEIQKLFGFDSEVKLESKVLSGEKFRWKRRSQEEAGLLLRVTYEDRKQSSHSVIVSTYTKGTVLGMGIAEYKKKFDELDSSLKERLDKKGLSLETRNDHRRNALQPTGIRLSW